MKKAYVSFTIFMAFTLCGVGLNAQQKKWTLEDCIKKAMQSTRVNQSKIALDQAVLDKKTAIGRFLPTFSGSMSHSWNIGLNTNPVTNTNVTATTQNTSLGVGANWVLFDGLQNLNNMRLTNLAILAQKYQLADMQDNIALEVANAFLQVLFATETLHTTQNQLDVTKAQYERTAQFVEAGSLPKGDLLEIKASLLTQEQELVQAKNRADIARIALANLVEIQDYSAFTLDTSAYAVLQAPKPLEQNLDTIYQKALENRKEIWVATTQVAMAKAQKKIAKGAFYPTLSGFYGFNTNYFDTQLIQTPSFSDQISSNKGHAMGLRLELPIFSGFRNSVALKKSALQVKNAEQNSKQTKIGLQAKVHQAYIEAQGAYTAYSAAQQTIKVQQEAFAYAQDRFAIGAIPAFELLQRKTRLENAQINAITAKYDYIFKQKVLDFYFKGSVIQ